jgi:hypothetical protein
MSYLFRLNLNNSANILENELNSTAVNTYTILHYPKRVYYGNLASELIVEEKIERRNLT